MNIQEEIKQIFKTLAKVDEPYMKINGISAIDIAIKDLANLIAIKELEARIDERVPIRWKPDENKYIQQVADRIHYLEQQLLKLREGN